MPRKATDMLDVFRHRGEEPTRRAPAAKQQPAAPKRGFDGLVLLPRHVLLGSAVALLLLVFAFVLGLSLGKRGSPESGSVPLAALKREAQRSDEGERAIYVEARVPYLDKARQAVNDPTALRDALVRTRGIPPERVWVTDEMTSAQLRILVGPFPSQAAAAEFLRRASLFTTRLGGVLPWTSPEYLWLHPSQLPAQHVPTTR